MTTDLKIIVGGRYQDDLAAFRSAWQRAENGEVLEEDRVLSFESWEGLASVLTGERFRLLKHLHMTPEPSVSALARSLGRQFRRVHADVTALEDAGLVDRSTGTVRATADRIQTEIQL
jgi:predicted transcriptional regulator